MVYSFSYTGPSGTVVVRQHLVTHGGTVAVADNAVAVEAMPGGDAHTKRGVHVTERATERALVDQHAGVHQWRVGVHGCWIHGGEHAQHSNDGGYPQKRAHDG